MYVYMYVHVLLFPYQRTHLFITSFAERKYYKYIYVSFCFFFSKNAVERIADNTNAR